MHFCRIEQNPKRLTNQKMVGTMSKKILITSALPYVNNVPHLGNIIGCVLSADVFARYCKSKGCKCIYVCGTDEYGTATEIKALEDNVSPKEICNKYYEIHKKVYEWFNIDFDIFGRTSTPKHTEITQGIIRELYDKGYLVEGESEQWYDTDAKMFLADRYLEGTCPFCGYEDARGDQCDKCGHLLHADELKNPISKISGTRPVVKKTNHLYIDLSQFEDELSKWIEQRSKEGSWSENSYKIAKSWIDNGLRKRAITRDLKWGVEVPVRGFEDKVVYVWFEAPIGYISITANLTDDWKAWWQNPEDVQLYQFMGKDNVPFHTVIFPATLFGTDVDWTMLYHINTTEYLNYEGGKFSKSRGLGVFGTDAMESGIPADVWRYYLLTNRPETSDSDFTWEDFQDKNNNELLSNLGNLVNRTLVFLGRNFDGKVPEGNLNESDEKFLSEQKEVIERTSAALDSVSIKDGIHIAMGHVRNSNRYFQDNKPWELIKSDPKRAAAVLNILANQIKDCAILLEPWIPGTSGRIFSMLGTKKRRWDDLGKLSLEPGSNLGKAEILFRKLEDSEIMKFKEKFSGGKKQAEPSFSDIGLEVGEVVSVEMHPDADKLYVEKIRMGDSEIQVVSGLAKHIKKEDLVGKKVIVVKNLIPAKLRGVESQGMLLVAETKGGLIEVLECPHCEPGAKITAEEIESSPKPHITIDEFGKVDLSIKDYTAITGGKKLIANGKEIKCSLIEKGKIS